MAELYFSEQADGLLDELEQSPAQAGLLGRINNSLDLLEADPFDPRCRRRRFQNIGCWGITIFDDAGDWLILWDEQDPDCTAVNVRAITRDP